jgi:hypothetical protein
MPLASSGGGGTTFLGAIVICLPFSRSSAIRLCFELLHLGIININILLFTKTDLCNLPPLEQAEPDP